MVESITAALVCAALLVFVVLTGAVFLDDLFDFERWIDDDDSGYDENTFTDVNAEDEDDT